MTPIQQAIVKTLVYADLFNQALSIEELRTYLVNKKATHIELEKAIRDFKHIRIRNQAICLSGRENLLSIKDLQQRTRQRKLAIARRWLWIFKACPWIKLVAITGSVAGGSPGLRDDIDLVIITAPRRLWLSRFCIVLVLSLLGKRRTPIDDPQNVNNKLCLNMWLSQDNLTTQHQDLYVAYELAHMVVLLDRNNTKQQYLAANSWLKSYLPNFWVESSINNIKSQNIKLPSGNHFLDWLDNRCQKFQIRHMRPRTKETVTDELMMFHPKDYRTEILRKYEKGLKTILST